MNKVLLIICLFLCLSAKSKAQSYSRGNSGSKAPALIIGGVGFTVAGLLTKPEWYYQNPAPMTGPQVNKPFFQQRTRMLPVVCGVTLTISGLITAIVEK